MIAIQDINWELVAKIWGPMGIVFIVFILASLWVGRKYNLSMESTLKDARAERDAARTLREFESKEFLNSLRNRDDKMERGFEKIIEALERGRK